MQKVLLLLLKDVLSADQLQELFDDVDDDMLVAATNSEQRQGKNNEGLNVNILHCYISCEIFKN